MLRSELAATVRKAMNAVVSGEAAEERAKAAEQARAQVEGGVVGGEWGVSASRRRACLALLAADQPHCPLSPLMFPPHNPWPQAEAARNEADRLRREAQVRGISDSEGVTCLVACYRWSYLIACRWRRTRRFRLPRPSARRGPRPRV